MKSAGTQTDTETDSQLDASTTMPVTSMKRVPKWKRSSRLRKSIAVMESPDADGGNAPENSPELSICPESEYDINVKGRDNPGFICSPTAFVPFYTQSTSALPGTSSLSLYSSNSLDNLLEREKVEKTDFMLKYRQVSGDLRASQDLVKADDEVSEAPRGRRGRSCSVGPSRGRDSTRDRSVIESKTVRKEKRKSRLRDQS